MEADSLLGEAVASLSALRSEHADLSITPDDDALEVNRRFMAGMFKAVGCEVSYEEIEEVAGFVADNQCAKLEVAILRGDVGKPVLWQLMASAWIDGALTLAAFEEKRRQAVLEQAMMDVAAGEDDEESSVD